jgi:O-acetyl-ADP-ribose deacetylase (regulator of RNase III)
VSRIQIIRGDITKVRCDAIVNSANKSLLRGGGVDGAIHRAAGEELEKECIELGGCNVGEAKITKAYKLNDIGASWIIHAVGPRWLDGNYGEERLLEAAYEKSFDLGINYKEIYPAQCEKVLEKYLSNIQAQSKDKYRKEIREAAEEYVALNPIRTIAFPSISTGVYKYPIESAVKIALNVIKKFAEKNSTVDSILVVCRDLNIFETYKKNL